MERSLLKTTSSLATPFGSRVRYLYQLFRQYEARRRDNFGLRRLSEDLELYEDLVRSKLGKDIHACAILELGYGARPFRAVGMAARGSRVYGIDLEQPALGGTKADYVAIARRNGAERALKSLARSIMYDRREVKAFEAAVGADFYATARQVTFIVGDASNQSTWGEIPKSLDLVYSEDVFEHIPRGSIPSVLSLIANHVSENGLVLIRPNIWTGITGGHFVEWYHSNLERPEAKRRPPWSHLISGEGEPSVYLNKLTYSEYVEMFSKTFEIVEVRNSEYGLGSSYLTREARSKIPAQYSDEDLLTNNVLFVMQRRS